MKPFKDPLVLKGYISRIYQAVLNPSLMDKVFEDLRKTIDAPYGGFQVESTHNQELLNISSNGLDESYFPRYKEHYIKCEPWTLQSLKEGVTNSLFIPSQRILPDKRYRESEFYQDWGRHFGIRHAIGTHVALNDSYIFKANFQRHSDQPLFEEDIEYFLNLLHPHLNQFIKLSPIFKESVGADVSWQQALKYLSRPVWVVNKSLRLIYRNHCADQWMAQGSYLTEKNGSLLAQNHQQHRKLIEAIMQVHRMKDSIYLPELNTAYQNNNITLGADNSSENFWLSPVVDEEGFTNELVIITGRKSLPNVGSLKTLHGLTQRQAQICLLLMQGFSLQVIAQTLNISINTVRNTLASCFLILNVKSQSELIRLLFDNIANVM